MRKNNELNLIYNKVYNEVQNGDYNSRLAFIEQNAYLFQKSISDILYIHGQNSEYHCLKTIDEWGKLGYFVKSNEKATQTVIDQKNSYSKRLSYFDISQVASKEPALFEMDYCLNKNEFNYLIAELTGQNVDSSSAHTLLINYLSEITNKQFNRDSDKKGVQMLSEADKQLIPLISAYTINLQLNQDNDFSKEFKEIFEKSETLNFILCVRIANNLSVKGLDFFKENYFETVQKLAEEFEQKQELLQNAEEQSEMINNLLNKANLGKTGVFLNEVTEQNTIQYFWTGTQIELNNIIENKDLIEQINIIAGQPLQTLFIKGIYESEKQELTENDIPAFSFDENDDFKTEEFTNKNIHIETNVSTLTWQELVKNISEIGKSIKRDSLPSSQRGLSLNVLIDNPDEAIRVIQMNINNFSGYTPEVMKDALNEIRQTVLGEYILQNNNIIHEFHDEKENAISKEITSPDIKEIKNKFLDLPVFDLHDNQVISNTVEGALSGIGHDILTKDEMLAEIEELIKQSSKESDIIYLQNELKNISSLSEHTLVLYSEQESLKNGSAKELARFLEDYELFTDFEGRTFDFSGINSFFGINNDDTNQAFLIAKKAETSLKTYINNQSLYQPFNKDRIIIFGDSYLTLSVWTSETESEFNKYGYQVGYNYSDDGSWDIISYEATKDGALSKLKELEELINFEPSIDEALQLLKEYKDSELKKEIISVNDEDYSEANRLILEILSTELTNNDVVESMEVALEYCEISIVSKEAAIQLINESLLKYQKTELTSKILEIIKTDLIDTLTEVKNVNANNVFIFDGDTLSSYSNNFDKLIDSITDLSAFSEVYSDFAIAQNKNDTMANSFVAKNGLNLELFNQLKTLHEPDKKWNFQEKEILTELYNTMDKEIARNNNPEFAEKNKPFFEKIFITNAIKNEIDQPLEKRLERQQAFYSFQTEVYQKYRSAYNTGIDKEEALSQWINFSELRNLQNFSYGVDVIDDGKNINFFIDELIKTIPAVNVGDSDQSILEEIYQELTSTNEVTKEISQSVITTQNVENESEKQQEIHNSANDEGAQLELFNEFVDYLDNTTSSQENKKLLDFHFPEDTSEFYPLSIKGKILTNIEAIKLSKKINNDNRPATTEEQDILSQYVGWGGIANTFFDEDNFTYKNERNQLKELVSENEYKEMRRSSLTAYYTDPMIIRQIFNKLSNSGFKGGKILDPAVGSGNFLSAMSKEMYDNSELFAVEIDSMTANIAKQLHPNANIQITGFENTKFKDNSLDLVVSNVPFSDVIKIKDDNTQKSLAIHDYFILNSLSKVRDGGIVVAITSSYTMDKKDSSIRKRLAEKADLLGAIRLPKSAFKKIAGTEVTTDILFFQKNNYIRSAEEIENLNWITAFGLSENNEVLMNQYFHENNNQILGDIEISGLFGGTLVVTDKNEQYNQDTLNMALNSFEIAYEETNSLSDEIIITEENNYSEIKQFTYFEENGFIYYSGVDGNEKIECGKKTTEKYLGLIQIREAMLDLLAVQSSISYDQHEFEDKRSVLNEVYDSFYNKFGGIHEKTNWRIFRNDNYAQAVGALEIVEELPNNKQSYSKAEFFYKPTVRPLEVNYTAESALDALNLSINTKQCVDLEFMVEIYQKAKETIIEELDGKIFLDPVTQSYIVIDEYLSGDVKTKLEQAEQASSLDNSFEKNVNALKKVQPSWLSLNEIDYKIGTRWIPNRIYEAFLVENFNLEEQIDYEQIKIRQSINGKYNIKGKTHGRGNILCYQDFGTKRKNALEIFEDSLNFSTIVVRDRKVDENNNPYYVTNTNETFKARDKQIKMIATFDSWILSDRERVQELEELYNNQFNRMVYREFDGSSLEFNGLNKSIEFRPHQKNAIARGLQTNRALLAHVVGSGKTLTMIGLAMKLKELGLVEKPLFTVPNPIVNDFGQEFIRAYPHSNVLVATEKDFAKNNRRNFLARIATGKYDAIIMAQSQFSLIPLSIERQQKMLSDKIQSAMMALAEAKDDEDKNWTIKQQEKYLLRLQEKFEKLKNRSKKDDFINFEALGTDFIFVDEAHNYKNLYLDSVITSGVAGVSTTGSGRAEDMLDKVRYIQELNESKGRFGGVVFATGTPISNSMVELFTMMRYLEPDVLENYNVDNFNKWGSAFANIKTDYELNPEGTDFILRKRFSSFVNLPELMTAFKQVADIQTADMLNLPTPKLKTGKVITIESVPSEAQKEYVKFLAERAEDIRSGAIDRHEDNMLKITNEARLMALDMRLLDDSYDLNDSSKIIDCVNNVHNIWLDSKENNSTQIIFSDIGTPKTNKFNAYNSLKDELINTGIPDSEIAFIHDAKTDKQRDQLFRKMRTGEVRILIGSTGKLGTGVNVQSKLLAVHHIDTPWRPSDIEQRDGRIMRQGNENEEIAIYRYITGDTFDAYLWQIQEQKQSYITQIMTSKSPSRSADDLEQTVLDAAEVKGIAMKNPLLKEKINVDNNVYRLKLAKSQWIQDQKNMLNEIENLTKFIPIDEDNLSKIKDDVEVVNNMNIEQFDLKLNGFGYFNENSKEARNAFIKAINSFSEVDKNISIGNFNGFEIFKREKENELINKQVILKRESEYSFDVDATNPLGAVQRLKNRVSRIPEEAEKLSDSLEYKKQLLSDIEDRIDNPFSDDDELQENLLLQNKINQAIEFGETSIEELDTIKVKDNKEIKQKSQQKL